MDSSTEKALSGSKDSVRTTLGPDIPGAIGEGAEEFLEEIGEPVGEPTTLQSGITPEGVRVSGQGSYFVPPDDLDLEEAGRRAGQKAGKYLWKENIWPRVQESLFGGKLSVGSFFDLWGDEPLLTTTGLLLAAAGYAGYGYYQYSVEDELKVDFGFLEFEHERGLTTFDLETKFKIKSRGLREFGIKDIKIKGGLTECDLAFKEPPGGYRIELRIKFEFGNW